MPDGPDIDDLELSDVISIIRDMEPADAKTALIRWFRRKGTEIPSWIILFWRRIGV